MRKVHRQHERAGIGDLGEELSTRQDRLLSIPIEDRRPLRLSTLKSMMHEIACYDRSLPSGANVDTAVTGRVPGGRREPHCVIQLIIVVDEQRLASLHD